MGKPISERLWQIAITVVGGLIVVYFESTGRWLSRAMALRLPLWTVLAIAAVVAFAFWWQKRTVSANKAREAGKVFLETKHRSVKQVVPVNAEKGSKDGVQEFPEHDELEDVEIALLAGMAENPPSDASARGFAVDLGVSEGRAEYHLQILFNHGLVRQRGFVGGGGYELTQEGRRYLVEHKMM